MKTIESIRVSHEAQSPIVITLKGSCLALASKDIDYSDLIAFNESVIENCEQFHLKLEQLKTVKAGKGSQVLKEAAATIALLQDAISEVVSAGDDLQEQMAEVLQDEAKRLGLKWSKVSKE